MGLGPLPPSLLPRAQPSSSMTPGRRSHPTTTSAITIRSIPAESFIGVLERLFEHIVICGVLFFSEQMPTIPQKCGWESNPLSSYPNPQKPAKNPIPPPCRQSPAIACPVAGTALSGYCYPFSTLRDGPLSCSDGSPYKSQGGDRSPCAILKPCSPHFRPPRRPQIPSP